MSSAPEDMGGSVVRGGAWQTSSRALSQAYTVVVSIVAARALGAAEMGRLVFIIYIYTTLVALLASGLPVAVNRFTAELIGSGHSGAIRGLYAWARRVEAVAAAFGGGVLVTVFLAGGQPGGAWLAAAVACSAAVMQTIPNAILLGARNWRHASVVGLVSGSVAAAAKLILLAAGHGITALILVDACVAIVNLLAASFLARRMIRPFPRESTQPRDLASRARRYALGSTVGVVLMMVVLQRSEIIFLQHFSDDVQIALYSIPFSAVELLKLVPVTLGIAAASAFATLFGAGAHDRMRSGFGRATRLTLLMALPLTAASLTLGPDALHLAYGDGYSGTGPVLVVLVLAYPIVSLMFMSTSVIQGFGKQRTPLLILGAAAVVNVTLDLVLIPPFEALGAAAANATAQVVASALLLVFAQRLVGGVEWDGRALSRIVVAATLAGAAALVPVLLLPTLPGFLLGAAAFVIALALAAWLLRVVPAADTTWLEGSLGPRIGHRGARLVRALSPDAPDATIVEP